MLSGVNEKGFIDLSLADAAKEMAGKITTENQPVLGNVERYAELMAIYRTIYPQLHDTFRNLSNFAANE